MRRGQKEGKNEEEVNDEVHLRTPADRRLPSAALARNYFSPQKSGKYEETSKTSLMFIFVMWTKLYLLIKVRFSFSCEMYLYSMCTLI